MKELIGKEIHAIFVSQDQEMLKFVTSQGEMVYVTEADCCSETWFADIIFNGRRGKFFGSSVVSVNDLEVPEWLNRLINKDGRTRQEEDEVYGFQIKVASDYGLDIIFRNSSNGYYGGSCSLMDDFETKWNKEKLEDVVWTQITEDWQA